MKQVSILPKYPVWDRFVRVYHWSPVSCETINSFRLNDGKSFHQLVGYSDVSLVMAKPVWGFIATNHARFADILSTPSRIATRVRQLITGNHDALPGHNPSGALMKFALMNTVLAFGTTEWMQTLDSYWREKWPQNLHRDIGNVLITLATVHALAVLVMGWIDRTRLINGMITGVEERW